MPASLTYPGVYIEEVSSGVRSITGVSTSVTAFVGYTPKGSVNKATKVFNFGEFESQFGELSRENELGYAVRQFFFNGGSEAWIVRVAKGADTASIILRNDTVATAPNVLEISAKSKGNWGNNLRLDVDYNTTNPDSTFNLTVYEYKLQGTDLIKTLREVHRNLSMDSGSPSYAVNVINAGSQLIQASRHTDITEKVLDELSSGWSLSKELVPSDVLSGLVPDINNLDIAKRLISISVDGDGPYEIDVFNNGAAPTTKEELRKGIEDAVHGINPALLRFTGFDVQWVDVNLHRDDQNGSFLKLTSGTSNNKGELEHSSVHVYNASTNSASQILGLGLNNGGREREAAADLRPVQTGTTTGDLSGITPANLSTSETLDIHIMDGTTSLDIISITLNDSTLSAPPVSSLTDLAKRLQDNIDLAVVNKPQFSGLTVQLIGENLRFISDPRQSELTLNLDNKLAIALQATSAKTNVQKYALGSTTSISAQIKGNVGNDGSPPEAQDITGKIGDKSGLYALEDADIFNLLCIPRISILEDTAALAVISEAIAYCMSKRAFMILDPPSKINALPEIKAWMDKLQPSSYAALYFPAVMIPDPLDEFRLKPFPPSGTMAGLYARTDGARGVWKAPAGIDATLTNVQALNYKLADMENGDLNKIAINCLRSFPGYGLVSWGARTLDGADQRTSEWKYIPVRRTALFIEESLYRGLKWVVFEPNDEPLWAQIRLNVGAFMQNLFRQGAFQGKSPREAYFVKCDSETTTQTDINQGIVNILVGFAPLKPAEFVVIKIQQIAGQIQT
ncbi:MAG: phage tail sheath family protein [Methanotrichaceae archaeon]